jgi:hypothetical protein
MTTNEIRNPSFRAFNVGYFNSFSSWPICLRIRQLTWNLRISESVETHPESSGPGALISVAEEMNFAGRSSVWHTNNTQLHVIH